MQNLIPPGINPAENSEPEAAGRNGQTRDHTPTTDTLAESLNFDMLLALAASFPPPNQPTSGSLGVTNLMGSKADGQTVQGGPDGVDAAGQSTGYWRRISGWQAQSNLQPNLTTTTNDQVQSTGAEIHSLFNTLISTDQQAAGGADSILSAQPYRFPGEFDPAAGSGIDIATGDTPAGPDLRIVARNEAPLSTSAGMPPANLRVIRPDGSVSGTRPVTDLVDRLSDRWRQSFLGDDIDLSELPLEPAGPRLLSNDDPATRIDDSVLDALLRSGRLERSSDSADGSGEDPGDQASTFSGERSGVNRPSATNRQVIPLFGELMAAERSQSTGSDATEPAVSSQRGRRDR